MTALPPRITLPSCPSRLRTRFGSREIGPHALRGAVDGKDGANGRSCIDEHWTFAQQRNISYKCRGMDRWARS